ncbi:MAG: VanW family protein [Kofleriaceae bacterium]|nr:VanW family protein [Kofleriaceae bacterium]
MALPARLLHEPPWRLALRRVRRAQLAVVRLVRWANEPQFAPHYASERPLICLGTVRSPMVRAGAHPELERGKRHNVTLACTAIDGVSLSPTRPFSFWRSVGPVNQQRGFIAGMELQAGCAVPTIGGGICLLSNGLYQLAAELGWQILERHGHTAAVAAVDALDATVAFPHVDLRFAPTAPVVLSAEVRGDVLVLAAWAEVAQTSTVTIVRQVTAMSEVLVEGAAVATAARQHHVVISRLIHDGATTRREQLSAQTRRQLDATQPSCLSCNETACADGNRLLLRAGLQRDAVPK